MKKSIVVYVVAALFISPGATSQNSAKLVSNKTLVSFFSSTPAEDIKAANTASVSTLSKETGDVVFSVPMQGFEFKKSLMQKHYNSDKFLDTKQYPKAKLKARITNLASIDFNKNGTYAASVEGELTIKGVTKPVKEVGTITVKENSISVESKFNLTLADYGISFVKGKPSNNIAKTIEISVLSEY